MKQIPARILNDLRALETQARQVTTRNATLLKAYKTEAAAKEAFGDTIKEVTRLQETFTDLVAPPADNSELAEAREQNQQLTTDLELAQKTADDNLNAVKERDAEITKLKAEVTKLQKAAAK